MKRPQLIKTIVLSLALLQGSINANAAGKLDEPLPAGGLTLSYDVLLEDDKIGEHKISVHKTGPDVQIKHDIHMKVKVAFITAYELNHKSTEVWRDEGPRKVRLIGIESHSVEDGKEHAIKGKAVGDGFEVETANGPVTVPINIGTTDSFWVDVSTAHPKMIDSIEGHVVTAVVKPEGTEVLNGKPAQKFSLKAGKRDATGWFTEDLLVKAVINNDGHVIRYVPKSDQ